MKIEELSSKRRFTPNKYNIPYYYEEDILKSIKNLKEELKEDIDKKFKTPMMKYAIYKIIDEAFKKHIGDLE